MSHQHAQELVSVEPGDDQYAVKFPRADLQCAIAFRKNQVKVSKLLKDGAFDYSSKELQCGGSVWMHSFRMPAQARLELLRWEARPTLTIMRRV